MPPPKQKDSLEAWVRSIERRMDENARAAAKPFRFTPPVVTGVIGDNGVNGALNQLLVKLHDLGVIDDQTTF